MRIFIVTDYLEISIHHLAFINCNELTSIIVDENNEVYDSRENCNAIIETETNTLVVVCRNTTIPSTVERIGEYAYFENYNISYFEVPANIISIEKFAFCSCWNLNEITFESGSKLESIGDLAFANCYDLKEIEIPASVTSIGENAFLNCNNLEKVTFASGSKLESIGDYAFSNCYNLKEIEIPSNVISIGENAFTGCHELTSIIVDENNKVYDSRENCNAIIETESNTLIAGCQATLIPTSVTSIGDYAFSNCYNLKEIEIPTSVISIGESAFHATGLKSILIPSSVISIGENAFTGCRELTSIIVDENNKVYDSRENCNAIIETESNTLIAGCQATLIPTSVTSIGDYAFAECGEDLTSITISSNITSIGNYAFASCWNLSEVNFESNSQLVSIGNFAFVYCSSLTRIEIPTSVTSIGEEAFYMYEFYNYKLTIYSSLAEKPEGWHENWCAGNCVVIFGTQK